MSKEYEKYTEANAALDNILSLQDNWNGNGAKSFKKEFVEKCRKILNKLNEEPFVTPTACNSIQFEYRKDNGEYLEFEIFNDRIEVFILTILGGEKEFNLPDMILIDGMNDIIGQCH